TVTLTQAPWEHTFTGLPKFNANGAVIDYNVIEDPIENYTVQSTGNATEGFTFTNTNTETVDVKVSKTWVGPSKPVTFIITADDVELQDKTVTLTQAPWEHTFTGLPKFNANGTVIDYNVIEDPIENYNVQSTGNATEGFTFTNTNTETVDVKVSKTWVGPQKPATFHITADGRELVDKTVTLNAAPWEHTFTNLPKYNANGTAIVYDVTEDEIPGYTTTRTGTAETGFVFNNSNVETVAIKVSKIWIGLPGKATFRLTADNEELTDRTVTLTQAPWEHTFTNLPKFKADGSLIEYNVTEDEVAGYELTNAGGNAVEGFSFTNSRIVGTTNLQISKLWKSATGTEISAPVDSVNVQVLRNGTLVQEIRLTKEQNFKATVENLPVEDIYGNPYIYTVQESNANNGKVSIQGVEYNVSVQGSLQTGFIISNAAPAPTPVPMVAAPKTGDTQNIWFLLFSLLGASVCILFIKRKRTN
ncbi:MAG: Cna B-type domain-containing protein, partial [Eubacteriales bacterium]|nr:Cna B-type domain-containing protein [Eubacteriales bacterium]